MIDRIEESLNLQCHSVFCFQRNQIPTTSGHIIIETRLYHNKVDKKVQGQFNVTGALFGVFLHV